ncbi:hypothetical protein COCOBI_05-6920 [Coccomyxa sp. Obi]|nr:hypothetical protein COCOBI_05-6920 [Coccomyxa sp. Obi]
MARVSAGAESHDATSGASRMPQVGNNSLQDHLTSVVVEENGPQPVVSLPDIQASLGGFSEKSPLQILRTVLSQHTEQATQLTSIEESRALLWVAEEHSDWMRKIMQAAMNITIHYESKSSASQQITPVAAFLTEFFSLCFSIQEIAEALPNVKVLEWKPSQRNASRYSDADAANLLKAVFQGLGVVNPESPLVIGIRMRLHAAGVIDLEQDPDCPDNINDIYYMCSNHSMELCTGRASANVTHGPQIYKAT